MKFWATLCLLWAMNCVTAFAEELTALARVDPSESHIEDGWLGKTEVRLALSQGVPYRVFHLASPYRLVVDFQEADFSGVTPNDLLPEPGRISEVRFGAFKPGWSRLVLDLAEPMKADAVAMPVDPSSGQAELRLTLATIDAAAYAALVKPLSSDPWAAAFAPPVHTSTGNDFVVVIDPGHGGVDPGAVRDGVSEKVIMLEMALELRDVLRRTGGVDAILTRDRDVFVSLPARISIAHEAKADAFISLHADALSQGRARGATVYTLADSASDAASEQLAAQHNRSDILAGVDLSGADDQITGILLDLARQETAPRIDALAGALVQAMDAAGGPINKRPRREAAFSVLKSADIPSVLVEVGFLSDKRDLANLRDPVWRAIMVQALADGILAWQRDDETNAGLVRQ